MKNTLRMSESSTVNEKNDTRETKNEIDNSNACNLSECNMVFQKCRSRVLKARKLAGYRAKTRTGRGLASSPRPVLLLKQQSWLFAGSVDDGSKSVNGSSWSEGAVRVVGSSWSQGASWCLRHGTSTSHVAAAGLKPHHGDVQRLAAKAASRYPPQLLPSAVVRMPHSMRAFALER